MPWQAAGSPDRGAAARRRRNSPHREGETVKSLEFPEMTVQVVGNTAIVRHLWQSQTELEGKVSDTKIAVIQVGRNRTAAGRSRRAPAYRLLQQVYP